MIDQTLGPDDDQIEVVFEPGKVAIIASHGPMRVTLAFSPKQADQIAAALLKCAAQAVEQSPAAPPRPS